MIRNLITLSALTALVACGDGAPFNNDDVTGPDGVTDAGIPTEIASTVTGFTYNPGQGTMTLTGTLRDGDQRTTTFLRRANLDNAVYETYTAQDDALDEHTTVYARERGDVQAAVAVTGGQFTYYSGGVSYSRDGGFDPAPSSEANDTGLVTYAGDYAGLTNLNGPRTDMLPVPGNVTDGAILPSQAGPVTGKIFINVSFEDNNLSGVISQRVVSSERFGDLNVSNLVLVPTELLADGTFVGEVEFPGVRQDVGSYAGTIGGNDGQAMAGGIFASEHYGDPTDSTGAIIPISGEEEFGIFVLGRCGGPVEDPSPECDAVDPL